MFANILTRKTRSRQYYCDSVHGLVTNSGRSPANALTTVQAAVNKCRSRDVIHLSGVFAEAVVIPVDKEYLTFIGEGPGRRSCEWMQSAVGQTLVSVKSEGCRFENIWFRIPETAGIGIYLYGDGVNDARYTEIIGCRFQFRGGAYYSIQSEKGCDNVVIRDCMFMYHNTATYGTAIYLIAAADAAPQGWLIEGNVFHSGLRHIYGACRATIIRNNVFQAVGVGPSGGALAATTMINLNVGTFGYYNTVFGNQLGGDYSESVYVAGANDQWEGNYNSDVSEGEVGDNGITIAAPAA